MLQEVKQFRNHPEVALDDAFNVIDWLMCVCLLASLLLRWRTQQDADVRSEPQWMWDWDYIKQIDAERAVAGLPPLRPEKLSLDSERSVKFMEDTGWAHFALQCSWSGWLEALRTVLACAIVFSTFRLSEAMSADQRLARVSYTLIRIYQEDLTRLIWIILVLMFGFGVALGLLVPFFRAEGTDGPIFLFRDNNNWLDVSAGSSLWQTMYAVFGEFDLAGITSSPGAAFITPLFFYFYLFFITLPIINLLIAMFNESYEQTTEESASEQWHLRDGQACLRFMRMYSATPAPFNSIWLALRLPYKAAQALEWLSRRWIWPRKTVATRSIGVDCRARDPEIFARNRYVEQTRDNDEYAAAEKKSSSSSRFRVNRVERQLRQTEKLVHKVDSDMHTRMDEMGAHMGKILDRLEADAAGEGPAAAEPNPAFSRTVQASSRVAHAVAPFRAPSRRR